MALQPPIPGQIPLQPDPAVEEQIPMLPDQTVVPNEDNKEGQIIIMKEILDRIDDSLKIEREFRKTGQNVQLIYRGELTAAGRSSVTASRYNILNANVNILLPSLFSKNPKPDIRARGFSKNPFLDIVIEALSKIADTFMDDTSVFDAFQSAVKEVLLPGRGTVRVRWDPIVETTEVPGPNGMPLEVHEKLLDILGIEHVYWEDYTHEQVAEWEKCGWNAYRHLFTKHEFEGYFANTPAYQLLVSEGKQDDIFKWTDKQAYQALAKSSNSSRSSSSASGDLQDVIKKALVWEFWDKSTREIIWICQDMDGTVLRIDPDPLKLRGFFPSPKPLLAVTTTDKMLPKAEYTIYQDLAIELDEISARINALVKRIKVRGAYNGAQEELGDILKQEDGEMVAVNGLDYNFDIEKQVYIIDFAPIITALTQLYIARENAKQAMFEINGISDIVRGDTRASETLGAQRMKVGFANLRIQDRKTMVESFCRDTLALMVEVVCEHFSPESIMYYTDITLDEMALQLMRSDALRVSRIDVETDSTIAPDEQADQQQIGMMMQALAQLFQQLGPMVASGMLPIPIALEILKIAVKPFKHSTQLNQLINQYMQMLMTGQPVPGMAMPMPVPGAAPNQTLPTPSGTDNRLA